MLQCGQASASIAGCSASDLLCVDLTVHDVCCRYLFFAGACVLAAVVTYFFYPETKGLGIEEVPQVFQHHWFWGRFSRRPEAARYDATIQAVHSPVAIQ